MATFESGPPMQITATFLNLEGAPVDYSTIQFSYAINRSGPYPVTLVYSSGGSGYGVILKSSAGVYYVQLLTQGLTGTWNVGWQGLDGSGNIQAQVFENISVQPAGIGLF